MLKLDRIITVIIICPPFHLFFFFLFTSGVQAMPSACIRSLFLFNALYIDIYQFARYYICVCVYIYRSPIGWDRGVFFFWRRNNDSGLRWMKRMVSLLLFFFLFSCCDTIQRFEIIGFLSLFLSPPLSFLSPSFFFFTCSNTVKIWWNAMYRKGEQERKKKGHIYVRHLFSPRD